MSITIRDMVLEGGSVDVDPERERFVSCKFTNVTIRLPGNVVFVEPPVFLDCYFVGGNANKLPPNARANCWWVASE